MDSFKDIKEKQRPNYFNQLETKYNNFKEFYTGKYTDNYLQEQLDKLRAEIDSKKQQYERNLLNFKNEYLQNGHIKYNSSQDVDTNALSEFKYIMSLKGYDIKEKEHKEQICDFMDGWLTRTTTTVYFN